MTTYVAFVGSGISLIEADDVEHARWHIARQCGATHKPWLTRDLTIREPHDGELERLLKQGARVVKAKRQMDKPKK